MHRLGTACWLLLWTLAIGYGQEEKTPTFTWTGRWEKAEISGSYHSYLKLEDRRIACFYNGGESLLVSFTREPGNLFTWTSDAPLMTWKELLDLPDPAEPKEPAANRMMTRPTVVRLPCGDFLGLGAVMRGYDPVDGLHCVASDTVSGHGVSAVKQALLAGREAPKSAIWKYQGKVKGPLGDYQDKVQVRYSIESSASSWEISDEIG